MLKEILYVPEGGDIRTSILMEFHRKPYSGHLGYKKMILAVKKHFLWPMLKVNIALLIAICQECQLVKDKHQHPSGLLQPLPIPKWKWEVISMDFIIGLLKSKKQMILSL